MSTGQADNRKSQPTSKENETRHARTPLPRSGSVQPCAAANPAGASRLQSVRPVRRVAELGSLGHSASGPHEIKRDHQRNRGRIALDGRDKSAVVLWFV